MNWFFLILFSMASKFCENLQVAMFSGLKFGFGLIVAIILVLQFPPMELFKAIVNKLSL